MKPDRDAIVAIYSIDGQQLRPALFVFTTPRGFAWVEPSYRDPDRVHSGMHEAVGPITLGAKQFTVDGENRVYLVVDANEADEGVGDDCRRAIAWAHADIEASGTTIEAERERLRRVIADAMTD